MPRETRTSKTRIVTEVAPSLKNKFARWCKKNKTSMAQATRDLIQDVVR